MRFGSASVLHVPGGARLESWKEIAAYLKREVRTVQRWERTEGLPVHRHRHQERSTVFAYSSELDAWLENRSSGNVPADPESRGFGAIFYRYRSDRRAWMIVLAGAVMGGIAFWRSCG